MKNAVLALNVKSWLKGPWRSQDQRQAGASAEKSSLATAHQFFSSNKPWPFPRSRRWWCVRPDMLNLAARQKKQFWQWGIPWPLNYCHLSLEGVSDNRVYTIIYPLFNIIIGTMITSQYKPSYFAGPYCQTQAKGLLLFAWSLMSSWRDLACRAGHFLAPWFSNTSADFWIQQPTCYGGYPFARRSLFLWTVRNVAACSACRGKFPVAMVANPAVKYFTCFRNKKIQLACFIKGFHERGFP